MLLYFLSLVRQERIYRPPALKRLINDVSETKLYEPMTPSANRPHENVTFWRFIGNSTMACHHFKCDKSRLQRWTKFSFVKIGVGDISLHRTCDCRLASCTSYENFYKILNTFTKRKLRYLLFILFGKIDSKNLKLEKEMLLQYIILQHISTFSKAFLGQRLWVTCYEF